MAIVAGKIESLKRLKEALNNRGIYRFNSIGEINAFLKNYDSEKKEIPAIVKGTLNEEIKRLSEELDRVIGKSSKNIINKIFYYFKIKITTRKHDFLINNYESVFSKRCIDSCQKLGLIKEALEELHSLIAGAIGENSVVNELQKLSDKYYLINDFSLKFDPPIFNKRENDRIYSIQIDHLLICQSGVFILETKNLSVRSIESLDLRSPVEQIKRTNYALFVFLNSEKKLGLNHHHWGIKKIPIRNIIVMTNKVPKEEFQHVKVLSLNELNRYIKYFEEIFSESECKNIFNCLNNQED